MIKNQLRWDFNGKRKEIKDNRLERNRLYLYMKSRKLFVIIVLLILYGCQINTTIDENAIIRECSNNTLSAWKGWSVSSRQDAGYYIIQFHDKDTIREHLILIPDKPIRVRLTDGVKSADHFTALEVLQSDSLWINKYSYMKESILHEIIIFVLNNHVKSLRAYDDLIFISGDGYELLYSFQGNSIYDYYERIDEHWSRKIEPKNTSELKKKKKP